MSFTPILGQFSQSNCQKLSVSLTLGAALFVLSAGTAQAQVQREIINPSFEDVSAVPGLGNGFEITSDANVPGWMSTNGQIEIWVDGFQGRDAQDGGYLAELNPSTPVGLFQEVCLFNGETLSWDFHHSARGNRPNPQTAQYQVTDLSGGVIQTLVTNSVAANGNNADNPWDNVVGSTIYTGPTGTQRIQFSSTNGGSNGNFLDNINVALVPIITLTPTMSSDFETGSGPYPEVSISGELLSPTTVTFSILPSSTATLGADYTLASNTISIPAGTYDGVSAASLFALPVTVLTDGVVDPNETIIFQIDSAVAANPALSPVLASAQSVCDNGTLPMATHTILDVPPVPSLAMTKVADNPGPHDVGDVITYTYTVENDGETIIRDVAISDTHNGSDPAPVPGNETLLTDAAPTGDSTDAAVNGLWDVLAPGDVVTFTGTYTVTQADVDNL